MATRLVRYIVVVAASAGLTMTAARADGLRQPPPPAALFVNPAVAVKTAPNFYSKFLAPRLDSRLRGEAEAALDFTNRAANPWMHDADSVSRMERGALRATTGAIKRYVVERLELDTLSVPLRGGSGQGLAALKTDAGGTRLRFGFSHRMPRAEVIVPSASGRFAISIDGRGAVGASFETPGSMLRFSAALVPSEHMATFGLVRRF